MKNVLKILTCALALVMLFSFASCVTPSIEALDATFEKLEDAKTIKSYTKTTDEAELDMELLALGMIFDIEFEEGMVAEYELVDKKGNTVMVMVFEKATDAQLLDSADLDDVADFFGTKKLAYDRVGKVVIIGNKTLAEKVIAAI